jgi:hypothetical protein
MSQDAALDSRRTAAGLPERAVAACAKIFDVRQATFTPRDTWACVLTNLVIFLVIGLAGYAGTSWWFVLAGAVALTLDGWWAKLRLLRHEPRMTWSSKITTYFVTGFVTNIGFAAFVYGAGRVARVAVG